MVKTLLAATAAIALMSGVGFAQTTYSGTSTETTTVAPPHHDVDVTTTERRSEDANGVLVEKDTRGDEVIKPGAATTSRTDSETTIQH